MKKSILILLFVFSSIVLFAQNNEISKKFEFNSLTEKDAKFVLKDAYNHYLFSVINIDGMLRNNIINLRKFDQKNQLVQTFTQDFAPKDISTLNNYLASYEIGNDKIVVFTESYSGKLKKKEIFKHVFDKTTGKFETSLVTTYPIESLSKSGDTYVRKSENNKYIGICFRRNSPKKEPESVNLIMLDFNTLNTVWQKDVTFESTFVTRSITVTNSGKAVLLREPNSYKEKNYLVLVSAEGQEDKTIETEIKLHEPKAITIGSQDYLLAFNYPAKGIRRGDFQHLLFYDLEAGSTIQNISVGDFNTVKDIRDVVIQNIFQQNNEIILFAEAKAEIVVKPTPGMAVSWDTKYRYEMPTIIVLGNDGTLKKADKLTDSSNKSSDFYHSFGLVNIKGNYHINNGFNGGFYQLDSANNYNNNQNKYVSLSYLMNPRVNPGDVMVYQLSAYIPESNRLIFAVMANEKEMYLVNNFNFK